MNVKKLIEILQRLPGELEVMLPMESNVDPAKAAYIAMVAKSRRDWKMAPVGNFVLLDNDELSRREDTTGDPFQVVILDVTGPTLLYTDGDGEPVVIYLQQVDTLRYRGLAVPIWQTLPGRGHSTTPFIRYNDLPADLAEAFERWQYGAAIPFDHCAYHHDFEIFMSRGGKAEDAEIVRRYL